MKLSQTAFKLWRLLLDRPGRYTMVELVRDLGASKTTIRAALAELEDAGLISIEEE